MIMRPKSLFVIVSAPNASAIEPTGTQLEPSTRIPSGTAR